MKTTMRTKWTMKNNNNDEENKQKCQRNPGWYIEGRKSRDTVPLRRKSAGSFTYIKMWLAVLDRYILHVCIIYLYRSVEFHQDQDECLCLFIIPVSPFPEYYTIYNIHTPEILPPPSFILIYLVYQARYSQKSYLYL